MHLLSLSSVSLENVHVLICEKVKSGTMLSGKGFICIKVMRVRLANFI